MSDKDYGTQPDNVDRWRQRLYGGDQRPEEAFEPAWSEETGEPAETPAPVEPIHDYTDTVKWIQLRRMQWDTLVEADGEGRPPITRYLVSSRYVIDYRLREPGEEGIEYIVVPAPPHPTIDPVRVQGDPWGSGPRNVRQVDWTRSSTPAEDYKGTGWRHRRGGFSDL